MNKLFFTTLPRWQDILTVHPLAQVQDMSENETGIELPSYQKTMWNPDHGHDGLRTENIAELHDLFVLPQKVVVIHH